MKRIISCFLIAAVLLFSGCTPPPIFVEVNVKCEGVYSLECEYSLNGKLMGGRSVQEADFEKDIPENDTMHYNFFPEDFSGTVDMIEDGVFGISFTVVDRDGTRHAVQPAPEKYGSDDYTLDANEAGFDEWRRSAQFGDAYHFALEKSQDGYSIYPTN